MSYFASMFGDQVKFSFRRRIYSHISIGLFLVSIGFACKPEVLPLRILTEQEMVKVLADIYVAEEKASRLGIQHDSIKKIFPKIEVKVFERAGVTDSLFNRSMEYYKANPKRLEDIYTALIDSLNLKAQRVAPILAE